MVQKGVNKQPIACVEYQACRVALTRDLTIFSVDGSLARKAHDHQQSLASVRLVWVPVRADIKQYAPVVRKAKSGHCVRTPFSGWILIFGTVIAPA